MNIKKSMFAAMGLAASLGLLGMAGVVVANEAETPASAGEVMLSWGNTQMIAKKPADVMFSHQVHVITNGLDCDSCHPDTFKKKRGSTAANGDYNMASLEEGKYCGICHDGDTAFGVKDPETCKTCHGSNMKQPKTIVFSEPVKAVVFDHEMHTGDLGLECSNCHNDVFKMKMGTAESHPDQFTMQALYDGKYCGACHNGDDAFASNTKCTTCHIGVKGFDRLVGHKSGGEEKGEH